jgi:NAD(P)-dependent dehydrogenase (short-subunit alcohol dehydrogenase family)
MISLQKYLVNVATSAIHDWPAGETTKIYGLTKNSGVLLLQQLARDTPVSKMQIVSFHPGAILTPGAKSYGATERSLNWDDSMCYVPHFRPQGSLPFIIFRISPWRH